ncbi:MAG TPA: hypothetical protein EYH55_01165 [Methanothermococcus okinawensis]|uniref:DUF5518 domain-containing protein n=1 Tax=Methanothermococcus okinawensis TaxID=155863 RepID=A0A833EDE8_9EURY|nr:hypothetical protein [Methanothermococcus okinawensis]
MEYINEKIIKPALIGGVITGILAFIFSFIPLVGYCCCFLYLLSGIITGYLLSQEYLPSDRDYLISGALSGGIAGFVSWLLYALISILIILLYGTMALSYMAGVGTHYSDLYLGSTIMGFIFFALFLLIPLLICLVIGAAFGVVGAAMYRIAAEEIMKR